MNASSSHHWKSLEKFYPIRKPNLKSICMHFLSSLKYVKISCFSVMKNKTVACKVTYLNFISQSFPMPLSSLCCHSENFRETVGK